MMTMVLLMAQLHFLDQDNTIELQHDFFGFLMTLAPHDTNGIINGTAHDTDASTGD